MKQNVEIISWNVNGLRAAHKKGAFDWLLNTSPDIFCLQETKAHPDQLPDEVKAPPGYFSWFDSSKAKKGYSGVAIYSKEKPEKVDEGMNLPAYDQEGRFLAAHFKDFVLINVYFPNGGGGPERLKFKLEYYEETLKYLRKLTKAGKKVVLCGDVNTAHTEVDLARPKENVQNTGFLPVERAWIDKLIAAGFHDVWRVKNPHTRERYTYWDMKTFARERNVGWRIDYFFVDNTLLPSVTGVRILDDVLGSDHCPISLALSIKKA